MIDKSLVKKRFSKSIETYEDNAIVQKKMADQLVSFLTQKQYDSVFEIGCSSGILTKVLKKELNINNFWANDIVEEAQKYIKEIYPNSMFLAGDIEHIELNKKFDLIISNACLQWCNHLEETIEKLYSCLNDNGILAISIFGENNLIEFSNIFGIKNKEYSLDELKQNLKKYNVLTYEEDEEKLYFDNPIDILKHLKSTGVNSVTTFKMTKSKLKDFEEKYTQQYSENSQVFLTYNPIYIVIKKVKQH